MANGPRCYFADMVWDYLCFGCWGCCAYAMTNGCKEHPECRCCVPFQILLQSISMVVIIPFALIASVATCCGCGKACESSQKEDIYGHSHFPFYCLIDKRNFDETYTIDFQPTEKTLVCCGQCMLVDQVAASANPDAAITRDAQILARRHRRPEVMRANRQKTNSLRTASGVVASTNDSTSILPSNAVLLSMSLTSFLTMLDLGEHEYAIKSKGVKTVTDLAMFSEDELQESMGLSIVAARKIKLAFTRNDASALSNGSQQS